MLGQLIASVIMAFLKGDYQLQFYCFLISALDYFPLDFSVPQLNFCAYIFDFSTVVFLKYLKNGSPLLMHIFCEQEWIIIDGSRTLLCLNNSPGWRGILHSPECYLTDCFYGLESALYIFHEVLLTQVPIEQYY
jgi:hypothetical protein